MTRTMNRGWRRRLREMTRESDRYALITGASHGLGRALAEELAECGMNLILVALPNSGLGAAAREITTRHAVCVETYACDLTAPGVPEALCAWVSAQCLPVAVLINNAGVGYNACFRDSTLRENATCIRLNALATVLLTRLFLPELCRHPRAYLLNVASMAAFYPMPHMPVYAPTKAFIVSFSSALQAELAGTSVSVTVLCPNGIRTNAEACAKIEASGLAGRLTCMDSDQVARCALRGLVRGRAMVVPGFLNQLVVAASRLAPRGLTLAITTGYWGRTARRSSRLADTQTGPASVSASEALVLALETAGGVQHEPIDRRPGALRLVRSRPRAGGDAARPGAAWGDRTFRPAG